MNSNSFQVHGLVTLFLIKPLICYLFQKNIDDQILRIRNSFHVLCFGALIVYLISSFCIPEKNKTYCQSLVFEKGPFRHEPNFAPVVNDKSCFGVVDALTDFLYQADGLAHPHNTTT